MIKNIEGLTITFELVKLEMLDKRTRLDYINNLIAAMKGSLIMECIFCNQCLTQVNPLSETVLVNVREMAFGAKAFTVLEPQCPICGTLLSGEHFIHIEN
jgi:hypothetical protein